jgi:glycerol-3-phosphate dehydrogenase subunit B
MNAEPIKSDLCIIGAGIAGMSAAAFAVNRGLSAVQVGGTGEIVFASGLLDLMGVHPIAEGHLWADPWNGIQAVVRDIPDHPYARLKQEDIKNAFKELLSFLKDAGLPYHRHINRNVRIFTPLGTQKLTYCVPHSMWNGVKALREKPPCLLVDIRGLKGFSAGQIAANYKKKWPGLRTARISFPGTDHLSEVFTEHMASGLILPETREKLARAVRPHARKGIRTIGLPAMLGLYRPKEVVSDLEKMLEAAVFEIPTMPPSVPGLRLKEAFERQLRAAGIKFFSQKRVLDVHHKANGDFDISIGRETRQHAIQSKGIILASGRFIGGGLQASRKQIRETILDLPVRQPKDRTLWHHRDFLDPRGHPINRAGLEIDDNFRPLDSSGHPAYQALFAAGSILAHQDWIRMKCGAGLAIATALGAVNAFMRLGQ